MEDRGSRQILERIRADLGADWSLPRAGIAPSVVPLAARTDVAALATGSMAAVSLAAGALCGASFTELDADQTAAVFQSDRHLRIDGTSPPVWGALSRFFRTSDGWVRTHGSYPHHAHRLLRAFDMQPGASAEAFARRLLGRTGAEASACATAAGALCVVVENEDPPVDAALRARPLVSVARREGERRSRRPAASQAAPLRGIRVLDLTRVIAGPVATRTLALLGADVLRIDPPAMPELSWQHLDTGHGKRSTLLDLASDAELSTFERLLESADVVVTGYRASALTELGLDPTALIQRHPGLIVARLTAWGSDGADADRRGFDSLVQAASGISWIESVAGIRHSPTSAALLGGRPRRADRRAGACLPRCADGVRRSAAVGRRRRRVALTLRHESSSATPA